MHDTTPTTATPSPELSPLTYWPSRRVGEPDLAWFETRRRLVRRLAAPGLGLVLVNAMTSAVRALTGSPRAWFIVVFLLGVAAMLAWFLFGPPARRGPPSGVWTVDERGYPLAFVARKRPPELRGNRGVTHEAFVESVRLRQSPRPDAVRG